MKFKSYAKIIDYYDYEKEQLLECPVCSWRGKAKDGNMDYSDDLFDLSCPKCNQMVLVVSYPLMEDVKREYAKGNPKVDEVDFMTVKLIEQTRENMKQKIKLATSFAYKVHQVDRFQTRKGKEVPYILHPLSVANRLSRVGASQEIIMAGILHDTIEDSTEENKISKEDLVREFGEVIARMVNDVTEQDKRLPWEERKTAALAHIPNMQHDSLLVKSADVLDNLSDQIADYKVVGDKMFENFNAPLPEQKKMNQRRIEEIEKAWPQNPMLAELKDLQEKFQKL
ncbi:MAG: HD domain-containing protein [Candidatus Woykebacteria bacterium]